MNEEIIETGEEIQEEIIDETVLDPVDDIPEVTESISSGEEYVADQEVTAVTGSSNSMLLTYDDTLLLTEVQQTNYLLTVLVFLVLFIWVESRMRSAIWRYFGNGKPN